MQNETYPVVFVGSTYLDLPEYLLHAFEVKNKEPLDYGLTLVQDVKGVKYVGVEIPRKGFNGLNYLWDDIEKAHETYGQVVETPAQMWILEIVK